MNRSTGLHRSRRNRIVAGVAGGMAERFGVPIWLMRLIWILALLPGGVPGFALYILCWVVIPEEPY